MLRLRELLAVATEAVFPRRCVGCGAAAALLCPSCIAGLSPIAPPFCITCGLPQRSPEMPCRHCQEFPLALDGLRSVYAYQPPLREALLRFKYVGARVAARDLAPPLARYLEGQPLALDAVAPVPLHPSRQRERGFNQAEALAAEVAGRCGLPLLLGGVHRIKNTPPQARQPTRQDRWRNMQAAFSAETAAVSGRRILLIDDVCTTGATLDACGTALRSAGAAAVWGLTLARAL